MKFKGFNKLELTNPKIKNVREINNGIILISESDLKGQRAMIKKITKKTIPKLLLDGNFMFLFFIENFILKKKIIIYKYKKNYYLQIIVKPKLYALEYFFYYVFH